MTKVNLTTITKNSRAVIRARLEQQIAQEKSQMEFFAKLGDVPNEQYYTGRMHALCNLKWEL